MTKKTNKTIKAINPAVYKNLIKPFLFIIYCEERKFIKLLIDNREISARIEKEFEMMILEFESL